VELWLQDISDVRATVEIVVQDSGVGMSNEKLDAIFSCLEQVTTDDDERVPETTDQMKARLTNGKEGNGGIVGLGLAVVARIVRNMDGQLRLKSEEGKGSRFVVQLSFLLPDNDDRSTGAKDRVSITKTGRSSPYSSRSGRPQTPPPTEGEVTLVERGSSLRADGVSQKRSVEELNSIRSFRSNSSGGKSNKSNKSDVERMIDAISSSLSIHEGELDDNSAHRSGHNRNKPSNSTRASGNAPPHERPGDLDRRKKTGVIDPIQTRSERNLGVTVQGEKTPIKAVKMPDEFSEHTGEEVVSPSKALLDSSDKQKSIAEKAEVDNSLKELNAEHLRVLVAEDDPINSRIITKRLEKSGHKVFHTINGEECARAYEEKPAFFDVVLMDMQMPIVDGMTSTKMIRSNEKSQSKVQLSSRAMSNGRVPIFAVSASLVERNRQEYIAAGFDGWILKPIDFKRLSELMKGIVENDTQSSCLYKSGEWERGGWFHARQPSRTETTLRLSSRSPVSKILDDGQDDPGYSTKSSSSEGSGSITPTKQKHIFYDRLSDRRKIGVDGSSTSDAEAATDSAVGPE